MFCRHGAWTCWSWRISLSLNGTSGPLRGGNRKARQRWTKSLSSMEFLKDLWLFLKERKKWWLVPLIILIVLIAVLVILGGSSALAPFIYTLF